MNNIHAITLTLMMAVTLAGCSTHPISVQNSLQASPVAVHIHGAAKHGGLRTEITGNPLGLPEEQWTHSVTQALHGAHFGPVIKFSPTIEMNQPAQARLIIQFQPPASTNYVSLCDHHKPLEPSLTNQQDRLYARAALCVERNAIDWAYVSGPMPDSVNDIRFTSFTRALAQGVIRPVGGWFILHSFEVVFARGCEARVV